MAEGYTAGYGALGATQGLETLLTRRLRERAQLERERAAREQESLHRYGLAQQAQQHHEQQAMLLASHLAMLGQARAGREADDARAMLGLLPIGSEITPQERDVFTGAAGAPAAMFETMPRVGPVPEGQPPLPGRITFRGTAGQQAVEQRLADAEARAAAATGQAGNEVKAVTWKNHVIDANYNPKTQRYTYRGHDITDEVEHYEKPPAPDRVLVQTGEGYMTREEARRLLATGGEVPLATTSATRTMSEGARMLVPHIPKVAAQAEELDRAGLFGPVMGRVRDLATKFGTVRGLGSSDLDVQQQAMQQLGDAIASDPQLTNDRRVGRFAANLGLLMTGGARVHGGARGGGSPLMLEHFKAILGATGSLPMFLGRMDAFSDYMSGYAAGPGAAEVGGGSAPPAAAVPTVLDTAKDKLRRLREGR